MRRIFALALVVLAFPVASQAAEAPRLRAGEARAALAALGGAAQLAGVAGAPSGLRYVRAIPLAAGVPVQDALATVRVDAAGRAHAAGALAAPVPRGGWTISRGRAIALALRAAGAGRLRAAPLARRVSAGGVAAWEVVVPTAAPLADVRVTVAGSDGRLLGRVELGQHLDGQGLVFDPDPLVPGAAEPQDAGDADSVALAAALVLRPLRGLEPGGSLDGPFARVSGSTPALEPSGSFLYHRDDPRFEQVMAYYHTGVVGQRFRDLGLDTGAPVAISADAVPQDNSFFSAATRSIVLGTGGIDDGEDGGVIAHEYGHALQSVYAPGFPVSEQGMAVAEGFADYVAARHVEDATGDARRALCLFAWDARGLGADCARRLDGHLVYPRDLTGESHADGGIWSETLWSLRGALGADVADRLALASSAYLQPASGFADAAAALGKADADLYAGAHAAAIAAALAPRGLTGVRGGGAQAEPKPRAPRRLLRPLASSLRGHVLRTGLRLKVRAAVRIELRAAASGRAVRAWSRTLAPGTHRLELWVPVVRIGARYRVEFEAGTSALDLEPAGERPLSARKG